MSITIGQAKKNVAAIEGAIGDVEHLKGKTEEAFAKYDTDKSGLLDAKEARGLIRELCATMSLPEPKEADYAAHLKLIDQSKDGQLDKGEVFSAVQGSLCHAAQSYRHFLGLPSAKDLKDEDTLPHE